MIRIGIVGCGRILNAHLQGYKRLRELGVDSFRITALCARREADAHMFLRRGTGPTPRPPVLDPATGDPLAAPHTYLSDFQDVDDVVVYTDYQAMIAGDHVDAVNDFTTLALHHEVGTAALQAGKHLLTQKPLAVSVRAARQLVDLAQARGLTLGVFENVRQSAGVRALAWAVRSGQIGQVQMAVMGSLGGLWSPDRVVAGTPWRHNKLLAGGGGSIDIGVHQMHLLRYVVGEIAAVSALARTFEPVRALYDEQGQRAEEVQANVDDTYLASVVFEQGALGQLWWSWGMHGKPLDIPGAPVLMGSKGSISGGEIILDDGSQQPLQPLFERSLTPHERERFFPLGLQDPYAIQQWDWLQAIEQRRDPETSGYEGLRDLACAFAILESSALGREVSVAEILDGQADRYQRGIDEHYRLI
ncbi:MAG: Gfo/Idh/MocA family oxidoreductase [Herpetosiphonaceae bacterium]|nr:Gfo/Idh/MocA family oxidoreductase [Herpetosiphonaceae bacterium]